MKKTEKTYTMYKGKKVQTIDITPTWINMLPLLIEFVSSDNPEVYGPAKAELIRMAKIADKYVEHSKIKSKLK